MQVPEFVEGFELAKADAEQMRTCWAAGEDVAKEMLRRFLYTKSRSSQMGEVDPLAEGHQNAEKNPAKDSRIGKYKDARDKVNADTTSRLRYTTRPPPFRCMLILAVLQSLPCCRCDLCSGMCSSDC